ncbi:hypothetical protein HRG84_03090 [Flavisolibacter sp. BT320]|nr:hypothetical protein [Flavisolibacter longurius]
MRKLSLLSICLSFTVLAVAQDFPGIRTSNYAGVSSVFFNPANIADSRYRWDFNLVSASAAFGNDKASFRLKDIGKTIDIDSLKNKVFASHTGGSNGFVSAAVHGPSLFFNLNKKSALALTSRARTMANIIEIDGKLAQELIDSEEDPSYPYTISSANNMIVNANGWTEFGLSYAREIWSKGAHYIKGGISLKYLAGVANYSIQINRLNATIGKDLVSDDAYLTNSSGTLGLNFGGLQISSLETADLLKFKSTGFGADIGFVYEYRPQAAKGEYGELRRDLNKYKLRLGVALLDAGSISYERDMDRSGGYTLNIGPAERFNLNALADASVDEFKDTLNNYPQFFTPMAGMSAGNYSVSTPATLQVNADYNLHKGFYLNLSSQFSLVNSSTKWSSSQYYSSVVLTPRIESSGFGLYVPVMYNSLTKITAGASVRLGSFFVGSGSVLSAALGGSKAADLFFGIHIGSKHKSKE